MFDIATTATAVLVKIRAEYWIITNKTSNPNGWDLIPFKSCLLAMETLKKSYGPVIWCRETLV